MCEPKLPITKWDPTCGNFFFFFFLINVDRAKKRFEFGITNYDTIINYHLENLVR